MFGLNIIIIARYEPNSLYNDNNITFQENLNIECKDQIFVRHSESDVSSTVCGIKIRILMERFGMIPEVTIPIESIIRHAAEKSETNADLKVRDDDKLEHTSNDFVDSVTDRPSGRNKDRLAAYGIEDISIVDRQTSDEDTHDFNDSSNSSNKLKSNTCSLNNNDLTRLEERKNIVDKNIHKTPAAETFDNEMSDKTKALSYDIFDNLNNDSVNDKRVDKVSNQNVTDSKDFNDTPIVREKSYMSCKRVFCVIDEDNSLNKEQFMYQTNGIRLKLLVNELYENTNIDIDSNTNISIMDNSGNMIYGSIQFQPYNDMIRNRNHELDTEFDLPYDLIAQGECCLSTTSSNKYHIILKCSIYNINTYNGSINKSFETKKRNISRDTILRPALDMEVPPEEKRTVDLMSSGQVNGIDGMSEDYDETVRMVEIGNANDSFDKDEFIVNLLRKCNIKNIIEYSNDNEETYDYKSNGSHGSKDDSLSLTDILFNHYNNQYESILKESATSNIHSVIYSNEKGYNNNIAEGILRDNKTDRSVIAKATSEGIREKSMQYTEYMKPVLSNKKVASKGKAMKSMKTKSHVQKKYSDNMSEDSVLIVPSTIHATHHLGISTKSRPMTNKLVNKRDTSRKEKVISKEEDKSKDNHYSAFPAEIRYPSFSSVRVLIRKEEYELLDSYVSASPMTVANMEDVHEQTYRHSKTLKENDRLGEVNVLPVKEPKAVPLCYAKKPI